jgi:hypothetical protein
MGLLEDNFHIVVLQCYIFIVIDSLDIASFQNSSIVDVRIMYMIVHSNIN